MEIRKNYLAPVWYEEPERVTSTAGGGLYYSNVYQVEGEEEISREYFEPFDEKEKSPLKALEACEERGNFTINFVPAEPPKEGEKAKAPKLSELHDADAHGDPFGFYSRLFLGYLKEWRPGHKVVCTIYESATGFDFQAKEQA